MIGCEGIGAHTKKPWIVEYSFYRWCIACIWHHKHHLCTPWVRIALKLTKHCKTLVCRQTQPHPHLLLVCRLILLDVQDHLAQEGTTKLRWDALIT